MKFSIVASLFQSEKHINEFYKRITSELKKNNISDFEIILVDDGSSDNSIKIASSIVQNDHKVVVLELSRNFGHHNAMMTGLQHSSGDIIFLIDSDLEESPEWFSIFYSKLKQTNADVVYGFQAKRKGGLLEVLTGKIFYIIFNFFSDFKQKNDITTARLMMRNYVDCLLMHHEKELNIMGLWLITGFHQVGCKVNKHQLNKSNYTLRKKIGVLTNAISSFSNKPLIFIFYIGLLMTFISCVLIFTFFVNYFTNPNSPTGYYSIFLSIWLFGSLIIFFIGIVGIYLSKIFMEVKNRPRSLIKKIHKKNP